MLITCDSLDNLDLRGLTRLVNRDLDILNKFTEFSWLSRIQKKSNHKNFLCIQVAASILQ
ncbi:MAG: hypothetical protein QNJ63_17450 [Calothrix sp. MO_192.B10]|nr:hypothetical protein [Calothrix sp. MO_192.B10]